MDIFDNREKRYLYIIGNGFDLHHNLKTHYTDFRQYMMENGEAEYVIQLESFFQSEEVDEKGRYSFLLWSNLEKAIGNYDIDSLYHELTDDIEIDYDHMMCSAAQIEDSPNDFLAPLLDSLPDKIERWINSINFCGVEADLLLPQAAMFLSFNYTLVLEKIYHIPEENILHIHGVVGNKQKLIVGHHVEADESDAFDENAPLYEEDSKINIIKIMNKCRKNTKEIIARNKQFFKTLRDITDVFIYGHSYSVVDQAYFDEIKRFVNIETKWHLGCHGENDRKSAEEMMIMLGIPNANWVRFDF